MLFSKKIIFLFFLLLKIKKIPLDPDLTWSKILVLSPNSMYLDFGSTKLILSYNMFVSILLYLYDGYEDQGCNAGHHHVELHVGLVLVVEAAALLTTSGHGGHRLTWNIVGHVTLLLLKGRRDRGLGALFSSQDAS